MKDPKSVLVLQWGSSVYSFNHAMRGVGLRKNIDYTIFDLDKPVLESVYENRPQLLITGAFFNENRELSWFVNELRRKNRQLVIVFYSPERYYQCEFDLVIDQVGANSWDILIQTIKDFEEGKLRRNVPPLQHRQF